MQIHNNNNNSDNKEVVKSQAIVKFESVDSASFSRLKCNTDLNVIFLSGKFLLEFSLSFYFQF